MNTGFLWILIFFVPYGAVHSYMASISFKAFLEKRFPQAYRRFYRLFYNIFSVVTFLPLLALMTIFPNTGLYKVPALWSHIMTGGQIVALILFVGTLFQTDVWSFVGISQLFTTSPSTGNKQLITRGFYRFVRHPLYLFALIFIWLIPGMSWNVLGFNIGTTLYFLVGMYFEERKLLREFGHEYKQYQETVPVLLPFIKMKR